jgi:hypothetical protein
VFLPLWLIPYGNILRISLKEKIILNTDWRLTLYTEIPGLNPIKYTRNPLMHISAAYWSQYSDWLRTGRPRRRSSSPDGGKIFLLSASSKPDLGPTQPPIQWVPGILSPAVKRPGSVAVHSPPASAEVKNMWIYASTPPQVFMA